MIMEEKRDPERPWSRLSMSGLNFERRMGNVCIQRQNSACEF